MAPSDTTDTTQGGLLLRLRHLASTLAKRLRALRRRSGSASDLSASGDEGCAVSRARIEAYVGRPVNDLSLYERALRHRSVLRGQTDSHLKSNERLEFLGDAVLGVIVGERLYDAFPDRNEGFLTRIRAKLVNGPMLASYAETLGLGDLLLLSPNMAQGEGRSNPTILADAFEAVLGAVYLDLGFDAARTFVFDLLDEHVDMDAVSTQRSNFKSMLLEHVQADGHTQPAYHVIAEEGPSHDRRFTVEVVVAGQALGVGRARSKKQAEQQAAHEALDRLREEQAEAALGAKQ
ncbi:MAG: ribonuclease III [Bacteroidota bacterium]